MRIVLHIGQQKTGSSAIQAAFTEKAEALAAAGILYPILARTGQVAYPHTLLGTVLEPTKNPEKLHDRQKREFGTVLSFPDAFDRYSAAISAEVEKRRPKVLVLSTEYLFRPLNGKGERLKAWLESLSDDITLVAYVRRPSSQYLSALQQTLRTTPKIPRPRPVPYRDVLEGYREVFGARIKAVVYERSSLMAGDVVADFASRFVPEAAAAGIPLKGANVNSSSSAEVMAIMQDYMLEAGVKLGRTMEAELLVQLKVRELNPPRPRLRPEIADYVDRVSVDALWLRDTFGASFEGFPYDGAEAGPPPAVEARVADICVVDEKILRTLIYSFLDRLMRNDRKARRRRRQAAGEGAAEAKADAKAKAAAKARARPREAAE